MTTHPRLVSRETGGSAVYAPDPKRGRWVDSELARLKMTARVCGSFNDVCTLLVEAERRPQILVVDFDALTPAELFGLQSLRERGWFGSIIAIGKVTPALATSLAIDRVLRAPLIEGALSEAIASLKIHDVTMPIPTMSRGSTG